MQQQVVTLLAASQETSNETPLFKGHSCKIGNIPVPGTSENQNCQFYEIHHFSLIFTFLYYIVTLKHIRQSYCSDNQHVVAYQ